MSADKNIEQETVIVDRDTDEICCDGGHGALGHPRVFYDLRATGEAVCGYCGTRFVKRGSAAA